MQKKWIRKRYDDRIIILSTILIIIALGSVFVDPKGFFSVPENNCAEAVSGFSILEAGSQRVILPANVCNDFLKSSSVLGVQEISDFIETNIGFTSFSIMMDQGQINTVNKLSRACCNVPKPLVQCAVDKAVPLYCCPKVC